MNLIWVPNQVFAIYFLGYCDENIDEGPFYVFVQDEEVLPELRSLGEEIGAIFVDRNFVSSNSFEKFFMYSWGILSYQEEVRSSVSYEKLWLFGEGFINNFYFHSHARNWEIEGLVYFGYELINESFQEKDLPTITKRIIIDFRRVAKLINALQSKRGIPDYKNQIGADTFLIVDRYWGMRPYLIGNWNNFKNYLEQIVKIPDRTLKVVIKEVPSHIIETEGLRRKESIKYAVGTRKVEWSEIVAPDSDFPYLTSPEALFFGGRIAPAALFSFDGSTSIIAGLVQQDIAIVWPDDIDISDFFLETWTEKLVQEKSMAYRTILAEFNSLNDFRKAKITTKGIEMRELISRFLLEHYIKVKAAVIHERDAVIHERDAITGSTIWRATLFLRRSITFLRGLN